MVVQSLQPLPGLAFKTTTLATGSGDVVSKLLLLRWLGGESFLLISRVRCLTLAQLKVCMVGSNLFGFLDSCSAFQHSVMGWLLDTIGVDCGVCLNPKMNACSLLGDEECR